MKLTKYIKSLFKDDVMLRTKQAEYRETPNGAMVSPVGDRSFGILISPEPITWVYIPNGNTLIENAVENK